jgi:hypothetical protein
VVKKRTQRRRVWLAVASLKKRSQFAERSQSWGLAAALAKTNPSGGVESAESEFRVPRDEGKNCVKRGRKRENLSHLLDGRGTIHGFSVGLRVIFPLGRYEKTKPDLALADAEFKRRRVRHSGRLKSTETGSRCGGTKVPRGLKSAPLLSL